MVNSKMPPRPALFLATALLYSCVAILTGCGSASSTTATPTTAAAHNYTAASLSGQYAMSIGDVGSLHFNGSGTIDSGSMVGQFFTPAAVTPLLTGKYTVEDDGSGFIQFSYAPDLVGNVTRTLSFIILKDGSLVFSEMDGVPYQPFFANARFGNQVVQHPLSGRLLKQDPSAFNASAIAGTYVYGGCIDTAGVFTVDGSGNVSGFDELTALPFNYTAPLPVDSNTGLLNYEDQTLMSEYGAMYIVSSTEVLFGSSPATVPCDFALQQTPGLSLSTVQGPYVLFDRVEAAPLSTLGANPVPLVARTALITIGPNGTVSGMEDRFSTFKNVPSESNLDISGSATLNSGLGTLSFDSPSAPFPFRVNLYAASPALIDYVSPVQSNSLRTTSSGTLVAQQQQSYSTNSLQGGYAVQMDGYDRTMIARLTFDASGNVSGYEDVNIQGLYITHRDSVQGTYSVGADGRGTMTLTTFRGNATYALCLVSSSKFSVIGLDGEPMSGMGQQ